MSRQLKEMVVTCQDNVNLEEKIRLQLSERLPFAPEQFYFSFKKKGNNAVVLYNTDSEESVKLLTIKETKNRNRRMLIVLSILVCLMVVNFVVIKIQGNRVNSDSVSRQLESNKQYYFAKQMMFAKEVKKNNYLLLDKITDFLQQPIQINSFYVDQESIGLDAYVLKSDLPALGSYLSEHGLLNKSIFQEKGDQIWVLIKAS